MPMSENAEYVDVARIDARIDAAQDAHGRSGGGSNSVTPATGTGTGTSPPSTPTIRGRTPGNRRLAVTGGTLGALLIGLPHRVSMPGWAAPTVVVLGILVVVVFVGGALRDFFQRDP
jgi:hypothetical protein